MNTNKYLHSYSRKVALAFLLLNFAPVLLSNGYAQQTTKSDVPRTISYQGILSHDGDNAVQNGTSNITVTFYGDENGTSPIWSATYSAQVTNGVFDLLLGNAGTTPLPEPSAMNRPIWVGISVDGTEEMRPLSQLSSSAYAMNVPNNSISASKISADYVGSISVNGEKISGNGTDVNFIASDGLQMQYDPGTTSILLKNDNSSKGSNRKGANPEWIGTNAGSNSDNSGSPLFDTTNVVAGGDNNAATPPASPGHASILGGENNTATDNFSSIGGGDSNTVGYGGTVGGGAHNSASMVGAFATVGGGYHNSASAKFSTISGGFLNTTSGINSAIAGGGDLTVGMNSFGFNNAHGGITDVSGFANPLAYFGNVNLDIGNTDNTARSLVLWGPNSSLNYTGGAFSTSITAGSPSSSLTYVMPSGGSTKFIVEELRNFA